MKKKQLPQTDSDLDLASQVQQLLFPASSPLCSWCCVGVKNRMATKLGGDYFDFISMPDRCQSLFLGDVTGHGLHASVIMSLVYGFIHRATVGECSPGDIANGVNRFLANFAKRTNKLDHLFSSTLFFAIINPDSLKMHYVNCGQVPPLVKQAAGIQQLVSTGPPLGFFEQPDISTGSFQFSPGDRLLLYTDGLIEAKNPAGEQFGLKRLNQLFKQGGGDHIDFLDELFDQAELFCGERDNDDDMTAIVMDFHRPFSSY